MEKTRRYPARLDDLCVDTLGLQELTHSGRKTAVEIGLAAEAKIVVGRRVLWNVDKIKKYLEFVSE